MSLIILIGPPAVGKMTIGQELEKLSNYKLFHNHITIEMVALYFSYGTPEGRKLVGRLREEFFNAFSESSAAGYIFTYVWAFGEAGEREYIESISAKFEQKGRAVYWVELEADLNERLIRNRGANRLKHKPTKRDIALSEKRLLQDQENYRLNSHTGEIERPNYLRINNTDLSAADAAQRIWDFVK